MIPYSHRCKGARLSSLRDTEFAELTSEPADENDISILKSDVYCSSSSCLRIFTSSIPAFSENTDLGTSCYENSYLNLPGTEQFEGLEHSLATGYFWSKNEAAFKALPFFDQPEGLGAGSIFSTASDYAKRIRCMLNTVIAILERDS
jgi:hypothetical protein